MKRISFERKKYHLFICMKYKKKKKKIQAIPLDETDKVIIKRQNRTEVCLEGNHKYIEFSDAQKSEFSISIIKLINPIILQ